MRSVLMATWICALTIGLASGQDQGEPNVPSLKTVLEQTRVIAVGKYSKTSSATPLQPAIPEFEMVRLASQSAHTVHPKKGQTMYVFWPPADQLNCKPGDERVVALHVINSHTFGWMVVDLNEEQKKLIDDVPEPTLEHPGASLHHWFPHLTSKDDLQAALARIALIDAPPESFFDVAQETPVESLRELRAEPRLGWVARPQITAMLGLAGDATDALALEKEIDLLSKEKEGESSYVTLRANILAYLLLSGEPGVKVLRERWLAPGLNPALPRAAIPALQFVSTRKESRIPREQLIETAQLLFEDDALLPEVLAFSARHRNWKLLPRIQARFASSSDPTVRINLVRYLLTAQSETRVASDSKPGGSLAAAVVDELRKLDPETWKQLEATARKYPYKLEPVPDAPR